MALPNDYAERVYAGVLGKIIGVYLGRPFEQWTYARIMETFGPIQYYVNEQAGKQLVVTDDDISGTFTFLRALPDYGNLRELTPEQIGRTWLNYLIEDRTVLWWGGFGNSTEHTAYQRLKAGIIPPYSGSMATNGPIVAEQIGAQIFIDGWAMVAPGDPEFAVSLARRAASVSHDGEAIYAAQVLAAMEALAFVESDINILLDTALTFIPRESTILRMIGDIREWHARHSDWQQTQQCIAGQYNYQNYGGNCHVVPNHALVILGLLCGGGNFQKSLMITNTSGWDTDCNSGNLGCLLGIRNGLAGIDTGPDWRGPIADRLYLPTADGGRAITDAVSEAYRVINIGRMLHQEKPLAPKDGARFHFEMPGSVQGFRAEESSDTRGTLQVENAQGFSQTGSRSLALHYQHLAPGRAARAWTATFVKLEEYNFQGYPLSLSPTLYAGQTVRARLVADSHNSVFVKCSLLLQLYDAQDKPIVRRSVVTDLQAGVEHEFVWKIEDTHGMPIAQVGVELSSDKYATGTVYLDYLTWDGTPDVTLAYPGDDAPASGGHGWRLAWVNAVDRWEKWYPEAYHISQNTGTGMLIQGTREWTDYVTTSKIWTSLATAVGLGIRVQGMRRYYALLLCDDGKARLVKMLDTETLLGEVDFPSQWNKQYRLTFQAVGNRLRGWIDEQLVFDIEDHNVPLADGAVALVVRDGTLISNALTVQPI